MRVGVWKEQWRDSIPAPFLSGRVGKLQVDADELLEEAVNLGVQDCATGTACSDH